MSLYSVVFAPEASDQLEALFLYVADKASPQVAERFTSAIVSACEALCLFPYRGVLRADIRPGLRITHQKGRTIIAYVVDEPRKEVLILGIFHGGQAYETYIDSDLDDRGAP